MSIKTKICLKFKINLVNNSYFNHRYILLYMKTVVFFLTDKFAAFANLSAS